MNIGSKNPQAKLTEDKVKRIRELARYPYQLPPKLLAARFKVKVPTIYTILNGYSWNHVK
jgi:hypothetical protein